MNLPQESLTVLVGLCSSGLTAVLITHNDKLLSKCSRVIKVIDGNISEIDQT